MTMRRGSPTHWNGVSVIAQQFCFCFHWAAGFQTGVYLFYFLRKRASGFHAKTFAGCFVFSTICAFTIFRFTVPLCSTTVQVVICAVSTALIFGLAPFDHPNMHMSSAELEASRKIARRNTIILDTAFLVAHICSAYDLAAGTSLALGYTALLLLLAYGIPNHRSRKEDIVNE